MPYSDALAGITEQFTVRFAALGQKVQVFSGETLLQAALREGIRIDGACAGRGSCGNCLVRILSGQVEFLQKIGISMTDGEKSDAWVRACQVRPLSDCLVEIGTRSLAVVVRTDIESRMAGDTFDFKPMVRTHDIALDRDGGMAESAALELFFQALGEGSQRIADKEASQVLPQMLHENKGYLRACLRDHELIGCNPPGKRTLGLAVDLGTTNCAGFLIDLETGERLASIGMENPQRAYGSDIISRINFAIQSPTGSQELQTAAVAAIELLARNLCDSISAQPDEIADLVVCGNTAMHHLLLGLSVSQLGRAPFIPMTCAPIDMKARELCLSVMPGAYLHLLPNIDAFVGGDHIATLMATEKLWSNTTSIIMDIGTNTELSLVHGGEILTTSCPSGPALEGGHISSGMRAAEGAIEKVSLVAGCIKTQVIGDVPAVGLCGSGVLDAIAILLKADRIDARGRICAVHTDVHGTDAQRAYRLAPNVSLTQDDVRAVQLAKAAIRAGIDLLLREFGLTEQSIERFVIAGAFGAYLDINSAIEIGLFPVLPLERFEQVGNAAGAGARMALVSSAAREHARHLATRSRHIELNSLQGFQKAFLSRIPLR